MESKSDLIDEEVAKELIKTKLDDEELDINVIDLNEIEAEKINKEPGLYQTINIKYLDYENMKLIEKITNNLAILIKNVISYLKIKKHKKIFIVGLGNKHVTPDAIGPRVIENLIITNHLDSTDVKIASLAPGVMGQTGLETAMITKAVVKDYKPDLVIAVDALATKNTKRLFRSIQLATSGIAPGSGVLNKRKEISSKTLGVDVLAIGVPSVCDIYSILNDYDVDEHELEDNLFLTTKDVDEAIEILSIIIAKAINIALLNIEIQQDF